MAKKILILGIDAAALEQTKAAVSSWSSIQAYTGKSLQNFREIFSENDGEIDYVFLGGGLPLADRLTIVEETVKGNRSASIFMKDAATGATGFAPWTRSIIDGLESSGYTTK